MGFGLLAALSAMASVAAAMKSVFSKAGPTTPEKAKKPDAGEPNVMETHSPGSAPESVKSAESESGGPPPGGERRTSFLFPRVTAAGQTVTGVYNNLNKMVMKKWSGESNILMHPVPYTQAPKPGEGPVDSYMLRFTHKPWEEWCPDGGLSDISEVGWMVQEGAIQATEATAFVFGKGVELQKPLNFLYYLRAVIP